MYGHQQFEVLAPSGDRRRQAWEPGCRMLTARERSVLLLVADGKTDRAIGVALGIAVSTARAHFVNAQRKLHAVSRAHAVARFILAGGHLEDGAH